MKGIRQGKALGLDGVCSSLFKLNKNWDKDPNIHIENQKKINFCKSILNDNYLNSIEAQRHFQTRLIALNKEHPKIPMLENYRPIVVSSPVLKLIEGLYMNKLRRYISNYLPH